MAAKVIMIASGKGGTGKSLFAANMGTLLAMSGKKVLLLDLDLGLRNLDLYLGMESRIVYNVMDVVSGMCGIRKALVKDKRLPNLVLMAASPQKDNRDITPLHMQVMINRLKDQFDYIIIDAPAGIGEGLSLAAAVSDAAVIISEPEVAAIRDADVIYGELSKSNIREISCVVNNVRPELINVGVVPSLDNVLRGLRARVVGFIQYDENILISANKGLPIVFKQDSYITKNFKKIVSRIIGKDMI